MFLTIFFGAGALWFFWSTTRPHPAPSQLRRASWGCLSISLAIVMAFAPGPIPTWASRAIEAAVLLTLLGLAASAIVGRVEQSRSYRADRADGLPARRPRWPTPLVIGAWFTGCTTLTWLVGQGLQKLDQAVLSPLLRAVDPAKVDTPEVAQAIATITGLLIITMSVTVVINFVAPLIAGVVHHRKVHAAEMKYALEVDEYLDAHGDEQPTGAVSAGSLALS